MTFAGDSADTPQVKVLANDVQGATIIIQVDALDNVLMIKTLDLVHFVQDILPLTLA